MSDSPSANWIHVAIGIIIDQGKILICRRRDDVHLGGSWEFPGGKVEPDESIQQCLIRELHEELGITARIDQALETIEYRYQQISVRLAPFICTIQSGAPTALSASELRWVKPDELDNYTFPPANARLIAELIVRFDSSKR
ncbi:MAG: 8-oxo-dGTP diphosphatase MutT [Phycisphaerales bacterium]|nr:8-oxo-dGTP diphosphatase MutT [Phycisphaerales bacterium]